MYGQNIDSLTHVIKTSKDSEAKATSYKAIVSHYRTTDTTLFQTYLAEGITYARSIKDKETELKLAHNVTIQLYAKGDYDAVIRTTDSLIPIAEASKLVTIKADMLNYKGNAYSSKSEYAKGVVVLLEYLSVVKTLVPENKRMLALANNNIGSSLLNMERYEQAIPYLNASLAYQEHIENSFKAHTYWNLGICYMEREKYDRALDIFQLGLQEAELKNDRYAAAGNQLCIGSIYTRKDDFEKGLEAYNKAYQMAIEANLEPYKTIEAINGIIYCYNQLSRPNEAMKFVEIADSITAVHKLTDLRNRQFLYFKSTTLLQLGRPREADDVHFRYTEAVDSLQSIKNLELIQEKETEFRTKEKEQQLELQEAQLNSQRLWITALSGGALLLALIGFLVYRQQILKIKHQKQEQKLKEALYKVEIANKLEEQRLRISKELHDNIGSQLTYLSSAAQNIGLGLPKVSTEVTQEKLGKLSEFSQEAITDLRDTIWVMNRGTISWEDLTERIRYLAHKVSNTTGITVEVNKTGKNDQLLGPDQTINIYRIIQEAVNNAIKHAQATKIEINIQATPAALVEILDNGKGYDIDSVTSGSHGLYNMESRAKKIEAALDIVSDETGTKMSLRLPYVLRRTKHLL
ncbi:tetratricopeptide repeat-containing sensor histidine kinase [Rasiella sp. SM2506]|uniref:tetratricopeptide repeat-containing sensor histidine kinase n=1 Tax=Rasiella sp. SM2506 TaxID=3423914 RepID=UPI003D7B2108